MGTAGTLPELTAKERKAFEARGWRFVERVGECTAKNRRLNRELIGESLEAVAERILQAEFEIEQQAAAAPGVDFDLVADDPQRRHWTSLSDFELGLWQRALRTEMSIEAAEQMKRVELEIRLRDEIEKLHADHSASFPAELDSPRATYAEQLRALEIVESEMARRSRAQAPGELVDAESDARLTENGRPVEGYEYDPLDFVPEEPPAGRCWSELTDDELREWRATMASRGPDALGYLKKIAAEQETRAAQSLRAAKISTGANDLSHAGDEAVTAKTTPAQLVFDYSTLDNETALVVKEATEQIRECLVGIKLHSLKIGQRLREVKTHLKRGTWESWLDQETGLSRDTADKLIQVADAADRFPHFAENIQQFERTASYLLVAASAPESAIEEASERAAGGEKITTTTAKEIVARHKAEEESQGIVAQVKLASGQITEAALLAEGFSFADPVEAFNAGQIHKDDFGYLWFGPPPQADAVAALETEGEAQETIPAAKTESGFRLMGACGDFKYSLTVGGGVELCTCGWSKDAHAASPAEVVAAGRADGDLRLLLRATPAGMAPIDLLSMGFNSGQIDKLLREELIEGRSRDGKLVFAWRAPDVVEVLRTSGPQSLMQLEEMGCPNYVIMAAKADGLIVRGDSAGLFSLPDSDRPSLGEGAADPIAPGHQHAPGQAGTPARDISAATPRKTNRQRLEAIFGNRDLTISIASNKELAGKITLGIQAGHGLSDLRVEVIDLATLTLPDFLLDLIETQIDAAGKKPANTKPTTRKTATKTAPRKFGMRVPARKAATPAQARPAAKKKAAAKGPAKAKGKKTGASKNAAKK